MRPPRVLARLRTRATQATLVRCGLHRTTHDSADRARPPGRRRVTPARASPQPYAAHSSPAKSHPQSRRPWAGRAGPRPAPRRLVLRPPDLRRPVQARPAAGASCSSRASPATPPSGLCWPERARNTVQRLALGGSVPPPPVAPSTPDPTKHSGFQATKNKLAAATKQAGQHPSPRAKADEAGKAAKPPADAKEAQAKAAKAGDMAAAPAGGFDKAAFIAAVSAAMAKHAPKNLEEADSFSGSGKSDAVAAEVKGKVCQSKDASAKPLTDASAKPPDTAKAKDKPVEPLPPPPATGPTPAIDGRPPCRRGAHRTDPARRPAGEPGQDGRGRGDRGPARQVQRTRVHGALEAKNEGEQHSQAAPAAFRAKEAGQLATAEQGAQAAGSQGVAGMLGARCAAMSKMGGAQRQTQTKNEARRIEVSGKVKSIFDATKTGSTPSWPASTRMASTSVLVVSKIDLTPTRDLDPLGPRSSTGPSDAGPPHLAHRP